MHDDEESYRVHLPQLQLEYLELRVPLSFGDDASSYENDLNLVHDPMTDASYFCSSSSAFSR
jgi:hypothetical protein